MKTTIKKDSTEKKSPSINSQIKIDKKLDDLKITASKK